MPLVLADRVNETTTTTGTGTVTLAGAVSGYQSFAVIGNANTTYYTISHQTANEWEVGLGTYTSSGTTLARNTVLASSNSGNLVNFSAGTKFVFCDYPAGRAVYLDTAINATIPGLTLSGGTANGVLYLNGSKVATSGSALTFDGTNLGIGTSSPLGKLQIKTQTNGNAAFVNSTSVSGGVKINCFNDAGSASSPFELDGSTLQFNIGAVEKMRLDSSGNLGIGTSSPSYKLQVAATVNDAAEITSTATTTALRINNTNANGWGSNIAINTGGTAAGYFGTIGSLLGNTTQDLAVYANTGNGFRVYTNGNNLRAIFDSSGNLGIGTSSPTAKLHVVGGGSNITALLADSAGPYLSFLDTGNAEYAIGIPDNSGALAFVTGRNNSGNAGTERMRLDSSGNLGIGTSSPSHPLQVRRAGGAGSLGISIDSVGSTDRAVQYFSIQDSAAGVGAGHAFYYRAPGSTTDTLGVLLDEGGNLGIGTSSPAGRLHIQASGAVQQYIVSTSATSQDNTIVSLANSGTVYSTLDFDTADYKFKTSGTERARITAAGNVVAGGSVALATNATDGFLYVPTCAGTPTGTPTAITGMAPIVVDTTNNKLYFYSGGQWRDAGP